MKSLPGTKALRAALILAVLPCALRLPAQPPHPATNAVPLVDVRFSVFVWPTEGILLENAKPAPLPRVFFQTPTGFERVYLNRGGSSGIHRYQGPLPIELFDVEREVIHPPTNSPPELKLEPQVITRKLPFLRADIPATARQFILVAFPSERKEDGTVVNFPLPYITEELKPGDARIYNAGDVPVAVTMENGGTDGFALPPFTTVGLPPALRDGKTYPRLFFHRKDAAGVVRLAYTTKLYIDPEKVNFFFLYPSGENRVKLLRVGAHDLQNLAAMPVP